MYTVYFHLQLHTFSDRLPTVPSSSKSIIKKVLTPSIIYKDKTCACKRKCLTKIGFEEMYNLRYRYWTKSKLERRVWLLDTLTDSVTSKRSTLYTVSGFSLCHWCFLKAYHINKDVYYSTLRQAKTGMKAPGLCKKIQRSGEYLRAMNWFETYVEYHCDRMPHLADMYLPYKTRKTAVYEEYLQEMKRCEDDNISATTFLSMWRIYYPNIKIKKVSQI